MFLATNRKPNSILEWKYYEKKLPLTLHVFALAIAATQCVTQAQPNAAAPAGAGAGPGAEPVAGSEEAGLAVLAVATRWSSHAVD